MDILKLALNVGPVKDFLSKQFNKIIYLKTGYHVNVLLNEITVKNENGKVSLHLDTDAVMKSEEFYDILDKLSK